MSNNVDWNYVVKLERAIEQKYGKEAVQNPHSSWSEEKEKEYLEQLKKLADKDIVIKQQQEMIEVDGFLVPKKLLNRDKSKNCPVCDSYLKTIKDDIYMIKFECCNHCFVQYVEDREERWLSGWRPNNEN
jgi:hypothetical protein